MIYRLATLADVHTLALLRFDFQEEFGDEPPVCDKETFIKACTDFLRTSIADGSWEHFVAEHEGEIIAFVSLCIIKKMPKPSELNGAIGYVTNTYTLPAYRNQGIGSKLLEQLTSWAKQNHLELLIVWPSDKSVSFYERNGFTNKNKIFEKMVEEYT